MAAPPPPIRHRRHASWEAADTSFAASPAESDDDRGRSGDRDSDGEGKGDVDREGGGETRSAGASPAPLRRGGSEDSAWAALRDRRRNRKALAVLGHDASREKVARLTGASGEELSAADEANAQAAAVLGERRQQRIRMARDRRAVQQRRANDKGMAVLGLDSSADKANARLGHEVHPAPFEVSMDSSAGAAPLVVVRRRWLAGAVLFSFGAGLAAACAGAAALLKRTGLVRLSERTPR
jgi:hypothetical protein